MTTSNALSDRLRAVAAEKTVRLTTRGRKTGLPRHVTVWFAADGDAVGIGTLKDDRDWVRNARRNPDVELEIGNLLVRGKLREVSGTAEHERIRGLLARKYWPLRIASWFGLGQRFTFRVESLGSIADAEAATPSA
jgi:deazaflavin-dependent oxidoreductase (nitroreductase family)